MRIADLGLSVFNMNNKHQHQKCGSPGYLAPEMFTERGYSYKADVFSLGSVFFNLLTGRFLFTGDSRDAVLYKNLQCDTRGEVEKLASLVSPECKHLLSCLIQKDTFTRPTAREALQHEWFRCDRDILDHLLVINKFMCAKDFQDIE